MSIYSVIGLMSGTSLDGVDIAFCRFLKEENRWQYQLLLAETIPYPVAWKKRLSELETASAVEFAETDNEYGLYLGKIVFDFIHRNKITADFISTHGHTIFHQPQKGFTTQIGKGSAIAAMAGLPVVCDFRSLDVNLGGQGAPLVPVGDRLLFAEYDFCLNLGGFANISFEKEGRRIAFDICPVNTVLNDLAGREGHPYDRDGKIASSGKVNNVLLDKLNHLEYYSRPHPKSLGREWLRKFFLPLLDEAGSSNADLIRTCCEHIAMQVEAALPKKPAGKMLVTGGGAFNKFLTALISSKVKVETIIPDADTINFKEAIIFALLGALRWRGEFNCLASVTGASSDNIGGAVYLCIPGDHK